MYSDTRGSTPDTCMTLAIDSGDSDSSVAPSMSVASPMARSSMLAASRGSRSSTDRAQLRRMASANCRRMRIR